MLRAAGKAPTEAEVQVVQLPLWFRLPGACPAMHDAVTTTQNHHPFSLDMLSSSTVCVYHSGCTNPFCVSLRYMFLDAQTRCSGRFFQNESCATKSSSIYSVSRNMSSKNRGTQLVINPLETPWCTRCTLTSSPSYPVLARLLFFSRNLSAGDCRLFRRWLP